MFDNENDDFEYTTITYSDIFNEISSTRETVKYISPSMLFLCLVAIKDKIYESNKDIIDRILSKTDSDFTEEEISFMRSVFLFSELRYFIEV